MQVKPMAIRRRLQRLVRAMKALKLEKMTLEELKAERRRLAPVLREGSATIEDAKRFMSACSLIQFMNTALQQANDFNAGRKVDGSAFDSPNNDSSTAGSHNPPYATAGSLNSKPKG